MERSRVTYVKNIFLPCVVFSAVTGILAGGLIFVFRWAAAGVGHLSSLIYGFVRVHPAALPLFAVGTAGLGLLSWLFLYHIPDCRGGGIPTAVGLLRGLLTFRWLRCILGGFFSAMVTYLAGIPLGTEGPSVQMGTAIGRGVVRTFGRNHPAWDRYVMTGGACAGFSAATGAPLTGILFAFEEAHERFSPMLLMVSAMTSVFGSMTAKFLFGLSGSSWQMFHFVAEEALPLRYLWAPLTVGLLCGAVAVLFTKVYRHLGDWVQKPKKIPPFLPVVLVFVATGALGLLSGRFVGSGHGLIEELLEGEGLGLSLLLVLCLRALLLIFANHLGVTGGLFVPSLAFGALLGGLCGKALAASGLLPESYVSVLVLVGMCSFLGASSRTPLMAVCFGVEALFGLNNILPLILGVALAYVVVESFGVTGFLEAVLEQKVEGIRKGKERKTVDREFTVRPDSFVIGKEIRDVLWPPSCMVLSVDRNPAAARGRGEISEGDVLHLHYQTWDPDLTAEQIEDLVGKPSGA